MVTGGFYHAQTPPRQGWLIGENIGMAAFRLELLLLHQNFNKFQAGNGLVGPEGSIAIAADNAPAGQLVNLLSGGMIDIREWGCVLSGLMNIHYDD